MYVKGRYAIRIRRWKRLEMVSWIYSADMRLASYAELEFWQKVAEENEQVINIVRYSEIQKSEHWKLKTISIGMLYGVCNRGNIFVNEVEETCMCIKCVEQEFSNLFIPNAHYKVLVGRGRRPSIIESK